MAAKEITSLQHPIVKQAVLLRQSKKEREAQKLVLISGIKQVTEAHSPFILFAEKGKKIPEIAAKEIYFVTKEILKKISGVQTPESVAALVPLPSPKSLKGAHRILGLNGISDPGNLGTLLRTAVALGWEGVFLTEGSVDPFNDKALRAAKGATFILPLQEGTVEELCLFAKEEAFTVFVADLGGLSIENLSINKEENERILLILGSEASGPAEELKNTFKTISIPIQRMESLNVAIAGSILMYQFKKRKQ